MTAGSEMCRTIEEGDLREFVTGFFQAMEAACLRFMLEGWLWPWFAFHNSDAGSSLFVLHDAREVFAAFVCFLFFFK